MARKRSPEYDYICTRCGCPAEGDGSRHLGGGRGMRACKKQAGQPLPVQLRREFEAEAAAVVAQLRGRRL